MLGICLGFVLGGVFCLCVWGLFLRFVDDGDIPYSFWSLGLT